MRVLAPAALILLTAASGAVAAPRSDSPARVVRTSYSAPPRVHRPVMEVWLGDRVSALLVDRQGRPLSGQTAGARIPKSETLTKNAR